MEKIFQETRVSTNHPSNNPRKARLRKGAEILVLFPRLCTMHDLNTRHDWPDKKSHCRFANQVEGKFETHYQ